MVEISVIVPVYNVEDYLNQCVDSILGQSFSNLELILVDNGSTDKSGKICEEYAARDNRVRVIHQSNLGPSTARNSGLDKAVGRYICFVDSDDYVSLDYCETLFNLLDGSDYDYSVCGSVRFIDGEEPAVETTKKKTIYSNFEYLGKQINKEREFGVWDKLYRRELFDRVRFADGKLCEDVVFSGDIASNCCNGVIETSKQCYFYRRFRASSESIVDDLSKRCNIDFIFAGNSLIRLTEEKYPELYTDSLWYALNFPWTFVDKIYVAHSFKDNREFLQSIQNLIRAYRDDYKRHPRFDEITRKRYMLFAKSRFLYGFNAYARLFRVYLYRVFRKDAYKTGHGI